MKQILLIFGLVTIFSIFLTGGFTLKDPQKFNTLNTYVAELIDEGTSEYKTLQVRALKAVTPTPSPTPTAGPTPPPTATPIPTTGPTSAPTPTGTACTSSTKVAVDFLLDTSGSMCEPVDFFGGCGIDSKISKLKAAMNVFAGNLKNDDVVGIQRFADSASTPLSIGIYGNIRNDFLAAVNLLPAGGFTNMRAGFEEADKRIRPIINNYSQYNWAIILVSDGRPNRGIEPIPYLPPDVVQPIKDLGVKVITIGYGQDADGGLLQNIASPNPDPTSLTGKYYYYAPNNTDLQTIYNQISVALCRP